MSAFHLTVATSNTSLRRTGRRDLREAKASLLFFCLAGALPGRLGTKQHSPPGDREPGQPSGSEAPPDSGVAGHLPGRARPDSSAHPAGARACPTKEHTPTWREVPAPRSRAPSCRCATGDRPGVPDCTWLPMRVLARACPTTDGGGTGAGARPRPLGRTPLVGT